MIRAIRYVASVGVLTLWYASKPVFAALAGVRHKPGGVYDRAGRDWGRAVLRWNRIAVQVEGRDHLVAGRAAVYIANHASFVDILAMLAELPGSVRFVYKKGMNRIPLLGLAMRRSRHIAIDRKNKAAAFAVYEEAAAAIREGMSAVLFAEGTRCRDGRLQPFRKGAFLLALAARVPVVPVLCVNTFETLPRGSLSPRPGTVTLRIGEPIPTDGMQPGDREELARRTRAALVAMGARE